MATASTFSDLQTLVREGGTVTLLNDIAMTGPVTVPDGATTTIEGGGFTLTAPSSRHFYVNGTGSLTLESVTLDGAGSFGGVKVPDGTTPGGTLILNGGAIIQNCYATGADSSGAAIATNGGQVVLNSGSVLQGNKATGNAGGVWVSADDSLTTQGILTMNEGALMTGNTANSVGGGVDITRGGVMYFNGGMITNNSATTRGGGINLDNYPSATWTGGNASIQTILYMTGGTISGNTTPGYGGGIGIAKNSEILPCAKCYITGGNIIDNSARNGGGITLSVSAVSQPGPAFDGSVPYLSVDGDTTLSDNKASAYGGGISEEFGTVDFKGGTISQNEAPLGGGVFVGTAHTPCDFNQSGGTIADNRATNGGGVAVAAVPSA